MRFSEIIVFWSHFLCFHPEKNKNKGKPLALLLLYYVAFTNPLLTAIFSTLVSDDQIIELQFQYIAGFMQEVVELGGQLQLCTQFPLELSLSLELFVSCLGIWNYLELSHPPSFKS